MGGFIMNKILLKSVVMVCIVAMLLGTASWVSASDIDSEKIFEQEFNRSFPDVVYADICALANVELN